jgi:hypothetical protein
MNPENPVVRRCAEGLRAEQEGRPAEAKALFELAWAERTDDYDGCVAAHYVARHQATEENTLRWNEEALRLAERVGDDRVVGFLPSLLLNLGRSCEVLGDETRARACYDRAASHLDHLPDGPYGRLVRDAIARMRRPAAPTENTPSA